MPHAKAYAAYAVKEPLKPYSFERREPGPRDVLIDILYCGVCHSDLHQVRDEWGNATFPMVPGHEIVGRVAKVGKKVTKWKVGDAVGVGCFVDSCRKCPSCKEGLEQYCEVHMSPTYNGTEQDRKTPTYGGYSTRITVDENYVLRIPKTLPLDKAAPLLCAGITTYSPLKHWKVKKGQKVGVVGLGGLGHMAVKLAKAMGAQVTALTTTRAKEKDAKRLGAKSLAVTTDPKTFTTLAGTFDLIINTVSAPHDMGAFLSLLKRDGTMVLLGAPEKPTELHSFSFIMKRHRLTGSLIGGIKETQEMLNFCGKHKITADIELIPIQKINEAYERMLKSDVRYRFVVDIASLNKAA